MNKQSSNDTKLLAVKYYDKHKNQVQTCKIFNCSPRSLIRWYNKYKENISLERKKRNSKSYKLTKAHIKFIKDELNKNKTLTTLDLTNLLNNHFSINFNRSTITRAIRDNNITLKQTKLLHIPIIRFRQPINIYNNLLNFYNTIKNYNLNDIICIDETSLKSFTTRDKCYEVIGKKCIIKTNSQEVFKKYTGIFAITNKKCIGYEIYDNGGIDSIRLIDFINKFITNKFSNKLIILDNASSHRNQSVKKIIQQNNNLLYTIPYQHYTNAIENYFSVLKSKLRKKNLVGLTNLKNDIKNILDNEIKEETYKNIIKNSYDRNNINRVKKKSNRIKLLKIYKD